MGTTHRRLRFPIPTIIHIKFALFCLASAGCPPAVPQAFPADLAEAAFRTPPQEAGPRCFWWWLNGNVTKEAITRDLEAMRDKGFSGALVFDAGGAEQRGNAQVPAGPTYMTPEWIELFEHAVSEADRLNLELSLNIQSGWNLGGPVVTPDIAAKTLTWSETRTAGPGPWRGQLPEPPAREGYYVDIAVLAMPAVGEDVRPKPLNNLREKALFRELGGSTPDCRFLLDTAPGNPGERPTPLGNVIDLSAKLEPDGTLAWDVPAGDWDVYRFGYTVNGGEVSTHSAGWSGLVLDYLSRDALLAYWDMAVKPIVDAIGGRAGGALRHLHSDSWECGGSNWTPTFADEFKTRRGYGAIPYLPVIAGRVIESREAGNAFLADFRKTIGECIAENHYKTFAELARARGMDIHPESGGPHAGPFDAMKNLGHSGLAMAEFWVPSPHRPQPPQRFFVKQASSVAHTHGIDLVGAEAFTSIGPHWEDVLWSSLKPSFEHEICSGLHIAFIHTFTCSPREMGLPGQEYFAGTHFNPNVTWWELAGAFTTYLARTQWLVQQGNFVADVLHYYGDHVPNLLPLKEADPAGALPGFDYDAADETILLQLTVENGRIFAPGGTRYRVLTLPDHKTLSLAALEKVDELLKQGANAIGPKPERLVSLQGGAAAQAGFKQLADRLWGDAPGASGERGAGSGTLAWGVTAREFLTGRGVPPDCAWTGADDGAAFDYIHYALDGGDVYFVCNQSETPQSAQFEFRVTGKRPELWDPVTGGVRPLDAFTQSEATTAVPLDFGPYGSCFIVFRESIPPDARGTAETNRPAERILPALEGPWRVTFDEVWGAPAQAVFDELISWTDRTEPGLRHYSGKGTYEKRFNLEELPEGETVYIELGDVRDTGIAKVSLNGREAGIAWTPPFRADVTGMLRQGENQLRIEVINSWRNRLVGDRGLSRDERYTQTNIAIRDGWELLPSGLLGPVRLVAAE